MRKYANGDRSPECSVVTTYCLVSLFANEDTYSMLYYDYLVLLVFFLSKHLALYLAIDIRAYLLCAKWFR